MTGSASTTVNYTFNVSIIPGAADGDSVLLTAVPSVSGYTGAYTFGYQWYRADDTAVSGAVSAAYDAPAGDSYYCRVTVSGAYLTTTSSAKSPIYQVTNDACSVSGGGTGPPGSYQTESGGPGGANSHLIPDRTGSTGNHGWTVNTRASVVSGSSTGDYDSFWNNVVLRFSNNSSTGTASFAVYLQREAIRSAGPSPQAAKPSISIGAAAARRQPSRRIRRVFRPHIPLRLRPRRR